MNKDTIAQMAATLAAGDDWQHEPYVYVDRAVDLWLSVQSLAPLNFSDVEIGKHVPNGDGRFTPRFRVPKGAKVGARP